MKKLIAIAVLLLCFASASNVQAKTGTPPSECEWVVLEALGDPPVCIPKEPPAEEPAPEPPPTPPPEATPPPPPPCAQPYYPPRKHHHRKHRRRHHEKRAAPRSGPSL